MTTVASSSVASLKRDMSVRLMESLKKMEADGKPTSLKTGNTEIDDAVSVAYAFVFNNLQKCSRLFWAFA